METINQMRKRHEREITTLEKSCSHKRISKWMDYMWAPGHFSGRVKLCNQCGKIVKQDNKPSPILQDSIDNPPHPISGAKLVKVLQKANLTQ